MKLKKRCSIEARGSLKTIEMTDEQYRRLLLIINLGKRTVVKDDDGWEIALADIEQYIQSFAGTFNSTDLVEYDQELDFYFAKNALQSNSDEILDYYDGSAFRFELTKRLTKRDVKLLEKTQGIKNVDEIEKIELKYLDEIIKNDVINFQLIIPSKTANTQQE